MMTNPPEPKLTHIVIEGISRQKRLFAAVFLAVVVLTVLVILFIPKRYEATAQLIIENLRTRSSLSTQPVDKVVMSDDVTETQVNSEVELLHSQAVLREALKLPPLTTPDQSVAQMTNEQTEVKTLDSRLAIDPVHLSSIIDVKLTEPTPKEAVDKLNAVFNAYFDQRGKLTHSTGAAEFFQQQTEDFAKRLDEDRNRLSDFELAHELVDMNDQKKIVTTRIASLDDKIAEARVRLAGNAGRQRELEQRLEHTPQRSDTTRRSLTNQYSQEHLATELVDLENQRTVLLSRYPPTDRAVIELNEKIATTRRAIDEASTHPASENQTDVNPVWNQIETLLLTSTVEIRGTAAEQQELLAERKAAGARLKELLQSTGAYEDLTRDVTETQNNLNLYAQKRDEARIAEALDTQKVFNVSLVQSPMATLTPVRPKPVPYFLAGLVAAFLLASILALYADRASALVCSPEQLDAIAGTTTLATIPEEGVTVPGQEDVDGGGSLQYRKLVKSIRSALAAPEGQPARGICVAFTSALEGEGVSYVVKHTVEAAASESSQRVAVLDMEALSSLAGPGGPARILMRRDPVSLAWKVAANANEPVLRPLDVVPEPEAANAEGLTEGLVSDRVADALRNGGGADGNDAARAADARPNRAREAATIDLGDLHGDLFWVGLDKVLERAREEFSMTLLDCPSLRGSSLAVELDSDIDGYVAVVGAGMLRQRQLEQVNKQLEQTSSPLIGYVLNRRTYPVPGWLYSMFW